MKRIIKVLIVTFLLITLTSCISKDGYKFISLSKEYKIKNSNVELIFDEDGNIPYISVEDYINMLDGVYYSKELEVVKSSDEMNINIEAEYSNIIYKETMIINHVNNSIEVSSLDFFNLYLVNTSTNYSEGLINLEPIVEEGSSVHYDLNEYDIDVMFSENKFYLPLYLINLIFNQDNYFDVIFSGDTIYGIDTSTLDNKTIKKIIKSSNNKEEAPMDVKEASYNYYRFITDYFYGLKEERNITDSKDFYKKSDFLNGDLNLNIFNLVNKYDDLHTGHIAKGFYNNDLKKLNYDSVIEGDNIKDFYSKVSSVQKEAITAFGVSSLGYIQIPEYEIINNDTLVIYLSEFDVENPKDIEKILKKQPNAVENVIIDLTFNTGGNLGAVLRMFTLMTDSDIWYHMYNKTDGAKMSYGVKGENKAYSNFNYYIKSSGVTFSAANLTVSIAKELGIKVIGRKSSGGASPISFFIFPNGSIINMSSSTVLANSNHESIELGIEPDIVLNSLYNKNEIKSAMESSCK